MAPVRPVQRSNNLVFTIVSVSDADSGIESLQASADVLLEPSTTWASTCASEIGAEVIGWTTLPVRVLPTLRGFSDLRHCLPLQSR